MPRNYQSFTPMISLRVLPRFSAIPTGLALLSLCGIAWAATGGATGSGSANPPAQAPRPDDAILARIIGIGGAIGMSSNA